MKKIHTLLKDIDNIFLNPKHVVDEKNLDEFGESVKKALKESVESAGKSRDFQLRMSNYGTPFRKLWYENKRRPDSAHLFSPDTYRKFLFGDILESLLIFFSKEAGHSVSNQQKEVQIDDIKGHIDVEIDNSLVDIKSASSYSFGKFKNGSVLFDDPFGYIPQISGYAKALNKDEAFFLVIDKQYGSLTLSEVDTFEMINPDKRISKIKEILKKESPPEELCYEPKEEANGNIEINKNCYYCSHKEICYGDANDGLGLRWFKYAAKPKAFIKINKMPRVEEISIEKV